LKIFKQQFTLGTIYPYFAEQATILAVSYHRSPMYFTELATLVIDPFLRLIYHQFGNTWIT